MSYRLGLPWFLRNDPGKSDYSWQGVREFWTKSFSGRFSDDYDLGVEQAQEDIEGEVTTNREALFAVPSTERDNAWDARRDGFEDTLRKNDGTTLR